MALLIFFVWLSLTGTVAAGVDVPVHVVIYDKGDPRMSVAIIEDKLYETEQHYRAYRIVTFDPTGVIAQDQVTEDMVRWPVMGPASPEIVRLARHHFIYKQMTAIYEAQTKYLHKFGRGYAKSVEELMSQGFLAGGFEQSRKQGYDFEVTETTEEYAKDPTFYALATPAVKTDKDYLFSVDHLGLVRFAKTSEHAKWAPVWNYADHGMPRAHNLIDADKPEAVLIDRTTIYER